MSSVQSRRMLVGLFAVVLLFGGVFTIYLAITQPAVFAPLTSVTTNSWNGGANVAGNVAYGAGGYSWSSQQSSVVLAPPPYYSTQSNYGGLSNYAVVTGFNFQIPSGATITGVSLNIIKVGGTQPSTYSCSSTKTADGNINNAACTGASGTGPPNGFLFSPTSSSYSPASTSISDASVKLFYNNVAVGNDHAVNGAAWSNQPTTSLYGGDSDTWGVGLTPAIVNAPNFGFGIAVNYNPFPNQISTTTSTINTAGYTSPQVVTEYYYTWVSAGSPYVDCGGNQNNCNNLHTVVQQIIQTVAPAYTVQGSTTYNYAYSTNAVYASINTMNPTVFYYYPFPTVTVTSGLQTTQTVAPVTSQMTSTAAGTYTVSYNGGLSTYTVSVTAVKSSTTEVVTSLATTTSSSSCVGGLCGQFTSGQTIGILLGGISTGIGAVLLFARRRPFG